MCVTCMSVLEFFLVISSLVADRRPSSPPSSFVHGRHTRRRRANDAAGGKATTSVSRAKETIIRHRRWRNDVGRGDRGDG